MESCKQTRPRIQTRQTDGQTDSQRERERQRAPEKDKKEAFKIAKLHTVHTSLTKQ